MGYNKENFKRIRAEYETKALRAEEEADLRRRELYAAVPGLLELDQRLSSYGLRVMEAALHGKGGKEAVEALQSENKVISRERAALLSRYGYPEDYFSVHYECDLCRDTGYRGIQMCSCMRRRLVLAGMESSGMSGLLRTQSFENFSLDYYKGSPDEARVMEYNYKNIKQYAADFSMGKGSPVPKSLLFLGGTGLGKTHLSSAVAKTVIEKGYDVYYNSAVGMISDFEYRRFGNSISGSEGDDTARYTECDLLIIDDLGTEVVNQFTLSCLYHLINTRLNLDKPTLISTNLTSAELRKVYSDRITSRLMGEYLVIPFYGTDVRKQKIQKK